MSTATAPPREETAVFDDLEIGRVAVELDDKEPEDAIEWAMETFGNRAAVVTSFQEDGMVILDMAYHLGYDVRVITVDTGRLHQETYDFIDEVRGVYPETDIEVVMPDHEEVQAMVDRQGFNLFRESVANRLTCCQVRKVRPLVRALEGLDAWFTGLRRDQWASRAAIKKVELDHDHDGIVKVNPLADWTEDEVWGYIEEFDVPTHPLYDQGYTSLGCQPCTRPTAEGEDKRAGRWWWEEDAPKECGMHCPVETGGFEHEVKAILGEAHDGHG